MKCITSIALLGILVLSYQKKENSTTSNSDSGYDSTTVTDPSVNTTTPMSNDSIPKNDSTNTTTPSSGGTGSDSTRTVK
ncbi:hypothetical protein H9Q08_06860 [Chryseobacterium sp. PS-8]|uniref:Uncharacterized protein n=1 Tax=Chryseobacterium indicum TaxID=2766954 RepID=A0ABS9C3A0_9FLAO|nr:hypothetical protein [Chryseobacterium sp. PS-8]MCF2219019.1 hypothetical protein [Chryseobacterium sp. PS-8]